MYTTFDMCKWKCQLRPKFIDPKIFSLDTYFFQFILLLLLFEKTYFTFIAKNLENDKLQIAKFCPRAGVGNSFGYADHIRGKLFIRGPVRLLKLEEVQKAKKEKWF